MNNDTEMERLIREPINNELSIQDDINKAIMDIRKELVDIHFKLKLLKDATLNQFRLVNKLIYKDVYEESDNELKRGIEEVYNKYPTSEDKND